MSHHHSFEVVIHLLCSQMWGVHSHFLGFICTTFLGFLQLLDFHQKDFCSSRESMDEFPCTSLSLWSCPLQQALKCSFKFAFPRIKQLRCFQGVSISQKITFWWYNLKRLKLTNFWHNMPSAAAKIFRRNFSTKIEVADKKFCTSYITQFAVSSKIFQKKSSALRCVAFHIFLLGLDLTWLFPDRRGLLGFSEINGSNHPQNSFWTKTKKGRIQHHLRKKLCGIFFCLSIWKGNFSFICLPVKIFVNGNFINLISKNQNLSCVPSLRCPAPMNGKLE